MSVAVGGVKVRVPTHRLAEAAEVLAAPFAPLADFEPPTPAEVAARRALTAALVPARGGLFLLVAVYNVGRVIATAEDETRRTWRRTALVVVVTVAWLSGLLLVLPPTFG